MMYLAYFLFYPKPKTRLLSTSYVTVKVDRIRNVRHEVVNGVESMHMKQADFVRSKCFSLATPPSRVTIERVSPNIENGRFPIKRIVGETVRVEAAIYCDGHDELKARLLFRHEKDRDFQILPLNHIGNDIWEATFTVQELGFYFFTVDACIDRYQTWKRDIVKKWDAGQDITVDLMRVEQIFKLWESQVSGGDQGFLKKKLEIVPAMKKATVRRTREHLFRSLLDDDYLNALSRNIKDEVSYAQFTKPEDQALPVKVERLKASFSAWYEFFPRSTAFEPEKHGTFQTAAKFLEYVADLGFDVVYLPPIHPIGTTFRKGKNNSTTTEKNDVGSPWAIGSSEGGHDAIHPALGTFKDFEIFTEKSKSLGMEVALDFAIQCSPDHPYVKSHPEWFKKRPDGTIQYAENPPKKYQDIYPLDFECADWKNLWEEMKRVVLFWVDKGVSIFRVDNPHTKPFRFWEWLISEVQKDHPDVLFLAEAFTRPHVMKHLAKVGFTQSYTYFTWRNYKSDIAQYFYELNHTEQAEYFRPNLWPNTPDILSEILVRGWKPAFVQRFVLAATLSGNYGIYGPAYELCINQPFHHDSEEYLFSEKYELKQWDLKSQHSIAPIIKRINKIRREHPAIKNNRSIKFYHISNEQMIAYSKSSVDGKDIIIVIVNLDPYHKQSGFFDFPGYDFGIQDWETYQVHDLFTGARYFWKGFKNYVELDPQHFPAHIFHLKKKLRSENDFDYYE